MLSPKTSLSFLGLAAVFALTIGVQYLVGEFFRADAPTRAFVGPLVALYGASFALDIYYARRADVAKHQLEMIALYTNEYGCAPEEALARSERWLLARNSRVRYSSVLRTLAPTR